MKKFLAIALTVVMVFGVASSALAFDWTVAAKTDAEKFGYKVEVLKFTRSTGATGSSSFNIDNNATAVNGADVYFAVRVTIPDLAASDVIRANAKVEITATGLDITSPIVSGNISAYEEGVYYAYADGSLKPVSASPVFVVRCVDTDTAKVSAKVSAKVTSERPLPGGPFTVGDYDITVHAGSVEFTKTGTTTPILATFNRNSDGKVTSVADGAAATQDVVNLYRWLGTSADELYTAIKNGEMYMSNANLRKAFGWTYKTTSEATWNANSTPIILDPNVSIPKTGDNASVIGFAMIMVAVVAAVAVKKVKA